MTITLRPEQEEAIVKAIDSGAYQSPQEVIDRALSMWRAEDAWLHENRAEINRKISRGIDQLERGQGIRGNELVERLAARKAAWLAEQNR